MFWSEPSSRKSAIVFVFARISSFVRGTTSFAIRASSFSTAGPDSPRLTAGRRWIASITNGSSSCGSVTSAAYSRFELKSVRPRIFP
jgi:hypothetical protein